MSCPHYIRFAYARTAESVSSIRPTPKGSFPPRLLALAHTNRIKTERSAAQLFAYTTSLLRSASLSAVGLLVQPLDLYAFTCHPHTPHTLAGIHLAFNAAAHTHRHSHTCSRCVCQHALARCACKSSRISFACLVDVVVAV